ncbi:MAG: ATP-binding cassette domain-containing protein [Sandaracinaceae bacterium]|nr:ATP-binding cassette domain-containing protein [Sandaracinaceae bacterium]
MIRVEDIHLSFKSPVLRGVSFEVQEGEIYALIGPGASGKSVLLKTIAGLLRPARGHVWIGDVEVTASDELQMMELRKKIGMLFQNYALFDKTVGENIAFPLERLFDMPEDEIRERVAERLAAVALPGIEDRIPASLSGGQKKRVGVARATIARAPVVLYDEPTAGLDPVTSQKIYNLIRDEQRAQKSTAIVISSDVAGVLTIADRVGMLLNGRLIFEGTVEEARASKHPAVEQFVHGKTEGPL